MSKLVRIGVYNQSRAKEDAEKEKKKKGRLHQEAEEVCEKNTVQQFATIYKRVYKLKTTQCLKRDSYSLSLTLSLYLYICLYLN